MAKTPDIDRLKARFRYRPETGDILVIRTHKGRKISPARDAGTVAISRSGTRHLQIRFEYAAYPAEKICYALWQGIWSEDVKCKDGDRLNLKSSNLAIESGRYRKRSGRPKRVYYDAATDSYRAFSPLPGEPGRSLHLGLFCTEAEAVAFRDLIDKDVRLLIDNGEPPQSICKKLPAWVNERRRVFDEGLAKIYGEKNFR